MRVLIIAEDPTQDYFILEPVIKAMLTTLGQSNAVVRPCLNPLYRGVNQVLKKESLEAILRRYRGMIDLFLLCIDRDGEEGRRSQLDERERHCNSLLGERRIFLAEHAWQEVEVWALAGCTDLPSNWSWRDVRNERDPKEAYFDPYVQRQRLAATPGNGRQALGKQAGQRYNRLRQLCSEDIAALEDRVRLWLIGR